MLKRLTPTPLAGPLPHPSTEAQSGNPGTILICDDTVTNLSLLEDTLSLAGYHTMAFPSGELALQAIAHQPPDLILLDIKMPGMDGYEVCRRLKADPAVRDIPVIFISAMGAHGDKVRAFQQGGADYVTKPFHQEEILARVSAHLELRRQQEAIRRQKDQLQAQLSALRALEAQRDELTHLVVHDLRTPLTGVMMAAELMMAERNPDAPAGGGHDDWLGSLLAAAREMREMINTILDLQRMESNAFPLAKSTPSLPALAQEAIHSLNGWAGGYQVKLYIAPGGDRLVHADAALTKRVIHNLLGNALKFTGPDRRVDIVVEPVGEGVRLAVEDTGPGVAPHERGTIFQKHQQGSAGRNQRVGNGLGLSFCRLALDRQGGSIGVGDRAGGGSRFWFTLPAAEEGNHIVADNPNVEGAA